MKDTAQNLSVIERDVTIDGTVVCSGKLIIKGTLKGSLTGRHVTVSKEGALIADANVSSLIIDGTFEGEARASEELAILSNGNCTGRVFCKDLVIEAGGVLNADVTYMASGLPTSK